jgi:hypothetical protein
MTRVQALRRHVVQRDHVVGVEGDHSIETCEMRIGKDRREVRNLGVGKRNHVLFGVEIVDGLIAEVSGEHECVGAIAGHEGIARAANQHLGSGTRDDRVVSGPAVQHVAAGPAPNRDAASAARHRCRPGL